MQKIIEIQSLSNGGHRNLTGEFLNIPEGWALIPEDLLVENFPFGQIETAELDGIMTVTKWVPGEKPEYDKLIIAPDQTPTEFEQLRADVDYIAALTGVEL